MNRNRIHKMMKKIGLPLFCSVLLLSCVSCGNIKKVEKTTKKVEVSEESAELSDTEICGGYDI
ncbi:MAG: hypothetical protein Q4D32_12535 [Eubacteriales bacterium]|nr:hypothetical protein [Eubacteriales bacterium]